MAEGLTFKILVGMWQAGKRIADAHANNQAMRINVVDPFLDKYIKGQDALGNPLYGQIHDSPAEGVYRVSKRIYSGKSLKVSYGFYELDAMRDWEFFDKPPDWQAHAPLETFMARLPDIGLRIQEGESDPDAKDRNTLIRLLLLVAADRDGLGNQISMLLESKTNGT